MHMCTYTCVCALLLPVAMYQALKIHFLHLDQAEHFLLALPGHCLDLGLVIPQGRSPHMLLLKGVVLPISEHLLRVGGSWMEGSRGRPGLQRLVTLHQDRREIPSQMEPADSTRKLLANLGYDVGFTGKLLGCLSLNQDSAMPGDKRSGETESKKWQSGWQLDINSFLPYV